MTEDRSASTPLRALLDGIGWSPQTLVGRVNAYAAAHRIDCHLSAKAGYHWLGGGQPRPPVPAIVARLLSQAHNRPITPADLGWITSDDLPTPADHGLDDLWIPGRATRVLNHVLESSLPTRRTFIALSGLALTGHAHRWLIGPDPVGSHPIDVDRLVYTTVGRGGVDKRVVDDIDAIVDAKRRVDDALGGGMMLRSVLAELELVTGLLKQGLYSEVIGNRLRGAAAELCRLAGWAHFDSGDDGQAQRYFLAALTTARESGDQALGSHILGFLAVQATLTGNPRDAIDLLKTAHEGGRGVTTATEQAALYGRLSRAYGRLGDRYSTDRCADRAFQLLSSADTTIDPPWIYWCDHADLSGMIGEGYAALHDPDAADLATAHLSNAINGLDPTRPRDRAIWVIGLAHARLATGDLDHALQHGHAAARAAAALDSDRVLDLLGGFRRALHGAPHTTAISDFDTYLADTFPTHQHGLLALTA